MKIAVPYNTNKNLKYCEDMSKSKNANRENLHICTLTKMSYSYVFGVE